MVRLLAREKFFLVSNGDRVVRQVRGCARLAEVLLRRDVLVCLESECFCSSGGKAALFIRIMNGRGKLLLYIFITPITQMFVRVTLFFVL